MSHYYTFSFDVYVYHRDLHSFPTRRSSDLLHVRRVHEDLRARRARDLLNAADVVGVAVRADDPRYVADLADRKSTRLNSSHGYISYAVFCLKKKKIKMKYTFINMNYVVTRL